MESLLEELATEVYDEKAAAVLEWRIETLRRAGFDAESSFDLAFNTDVDLHSAVGLIERGCPPATAVRILL